MCDIYTERCIICGREISWHLGGFLTDRDELVVACGEHEDLKYYLDEHHVPYYIIKAHPHLAKAIVDWVMDATRHRDDFIRDNARRVLYRFKTSINKWINEEFIVIPLTTNAMRNYRINHPNLPLYFTYRIYNWGTRLFHRAWWFASRYDRFNWDETGWWGE